MLGKWLIYTTHTYSIHIYTIRLWRTLDNKLEDHNKVFFFYSQNITNQKLYLKSILQHATFVHLHFFEGTHKFEEPVSKTTLNF